MFNLPTTGKNVKACRVGSDKFKNMLFELDFYYMRRYEPIINAGEMIASVYYI